MTRKEEVRNASVEYNEKAFVIGGDSILSEEEYLEFNKNSSFIAGAEWADEHPRKGLVDIEKVCEWLKENVTYIHPRTGKKTCIINLNRFKEAFY